MVNDNLLLQLYLYYNMKFWLLHLQRMPQSIDESKKHSFIRNAFIRLPCGDFEQTLILGNVELLWLTGISVCKRPCTIF